MATYKSLISSLITYACPIWYPNISHTSVNKLQVLQNSALRIATGCVKMTSSDHLHSETKVLKVEEHLKMISFQLLATCLQPNHPSRQVVIADPGPRDKKTTLKKACYDQIGDLLVTDPVSQEGYIVDIKEARREIHTRAVEMAISSRSPNRVLGGAAPDVDVAETSLPRGARTTLAQLRSGFCSSLEDFKHRIGLSPSPLCPCCRQEEHTVRHLFQCDSHPTTLTPVDLWQRPETALEFLRNWPCFERIDPERPPPEPPPTQPTTRGAGL